jgi:hypothetical protein
VSIEINDERPLVKVNPRDANKVVIQEVNTQVKVTGFGPQGIAGPAGAAGVAGEQGEPGRFTVSETAPASPVAGDAWFRSSTAQLYLYYDGYWVETSTSYAGPAGATGATGASGTLAGKYGAFQYLGRQAIASTTTAYAMPWDTTDFSGDIYFSNTSRINFPTAGLYNIQWSGQFQNSSNSLEDIYVWLRVNGTDIAGSTGYISIPARKQAGAGNEAHMISGWNYFLQFTAGQYLEIMWSASNTTVSLESYGTQTNPIRPSTAALILTAQQVA